MAGVQVEALLREFGADALAVLLGRPQVHAANQDVSAVMVDQAGKQLRLCPQDDVGRRLTEIRYVIAAHAVPPEKADGKALSEDRFVQAIVAKAVGKPLPA